MDVFEFGGKQIFDDLPSHYGRTPAHEGVLLPFHDGLLPLSRKITSLEFPYGRGHANTPPQKKNYETYNNERKEQVFTSNIKFQIKTYIASNI